MPDVVSVLTAKDIPGQNLAGVIFPDQPLLVTDRVRMVGDRLAVVAARTPEAAWAAARAVKADLSPLPGVYDPVAAMAPGSPKVHESGNVFKTFRVIRGDLGKARKAASVVVEAEYHVGGQDHAYLEPQGCLGDPGRPAHHDRRLLPVPVLHPARRGAGAGAAPGGGAGRAGAHWRRLRRQGGLPLRAGRLRGAARLADRPAGAAPRTTGSSTCRSPPSATPRSCATAGAPTRRASCALPRSRRSWMPAATSGCRRWWPSAPTSRRSAPTTCRRWT